MFVLSLKRAVSLCLILALAACSGVGLLYDSAPRLAQFELDSYIDLSYAQEQAAIPLIDSVFAWHRARELPRLSAWLKGLAARMDAPFTANAVAQEVATSKGFLRTAGVYWLPQQAQFVSTLTPQNLAALQKKYTKLNQKFESEWLKLKPEKAQEKRFEDTLTWLERVYGDFDTAQTQALRKLSDARVLNQAMVLQIRKTRQAEMLATLDDIIRRKPAQIEIQTLLSALADRLEAPTKPDELRYYTQASEGLNGLIAAASSIATPAQRLKGRERLLDLAKDADQRTTRTQ